MLRIVRKSAAQRPYTPSMVRRSAAGTAVAAVAATTIAAVLAGGALLLSGSDTSLAGAPAATFSERFYTRPARPSCSERTWPYLASECLMTPDGSRVRPARVIAVDRRM